MAARAPSSATSGFFQALPVVPPQYNSTSGAQLSTDISDDPILPRILSLYLPSPLPRPIAQPLHDFARLVLHPSTLRHTVDCDTDLPTLHLRSTFGDENKTSPLRTSEGWQRLKDIQTRAGVVSLAYPQPSTPDLPNVNRRINQFATVHLWNGSCAVVTCPMGMTDGAAVLLRRHLNDPDGSQPGRARVFAESYRRLISPDPDYVWSSGQWMTERTGGSDVRGTETVARLLTPSEIEADRRSGRDVDAHGLPLGPWRVDGFKWFSSATDADMSVLLAQTPRGLSAFYAPLRRRTGSPTTLSSPDDIEMNGVRLQRLKNKLGTKGVPTAELELVGMRAFLIGEEGRGVKEISSILNITRLGTACGSAGFWARGLAISRAYTKVRKVKGKLLSDNPQHLGWMSKETVVYRAGVHLGFFGVALLGASEQGYEVVPSRAKALIPNDRQEIDALLRTLTPLMKAQVSLNATAGLRACMESLGGVGYCENNEDGGVLNIARLFRDCTVNCIWEGTTSVMAEDVLRVVKNPKDKGADILDRNFGQWMRGVLGECERRFPTQVQVVRNRYDVLRSLVNQTGAEELHWRGREVLDHLQAVVCACLLMFDACQDGDEVAVAVAKRWVAMQALPRDINLVATQSSWQDEVAMDRKIFLGAAESSMSAQAKL